MEETTKRRNTFLLAMRHDFIENRKGLLLGLGVVWGIYFLFGALLGYNGRGGGDSELVACLFFAVAFSCIGASLAFSNMKTKEGRISTLMLPATAAEKFLVRWIAFVPVLFLVLVAGIYICDMARILLCWICNHRWLVNGRYMHLINLGAIVDGIDPTLKYGALFMFVSYFFNQAVYFFGAILWPKLSFIKTFAACWVLQTIFGFILVFVNRTFYYPISWDISADAFFIGLSVIFGLITLGLYYISFLLFKRSQVVYRLF